MPWEACASSLAFWWPRFSPPVGVWIDLAIDSLVVPDKAARFWAVSGNVDLVFGQHSAQYDGPWAAPRLVGSLSDVVGCDQKKFACARGRVAGPLLSAIDKR